jgi:hypothetical protein
VKLISTVDPIDRIAVDTACVALCADERPLQGAAGLLDWRLCGKLSRLVLAGNLTGQLGEKLLVHAGGRIAAGKLLVVGGGRAAAFHAPQVGVVLRETFDALRKMNVPTAAMPLPGASVAGLDPTAVVDQLVEALSNLRREASWLDGFALHLVLPEKRPTEVFTHLEQAARATAWIKMDGKRYRSVEDKAASAAK